MVIWNRTLTLSTCLALAGAAVALVGGVPMFYESIYQPTPPGKVEIKRLPRARALATGDRHASVERRSGEFMRLFRYIQGHGVSMTVPVEVDPEPAVMRFFVGQRQEAKDLPDEGQVQVVPVPERTVVSIGVRGAYTEARFREAEAHLRTWLEAHPEYRAEGHAYAVYWHGPIIPGFLKRSEVHLRLVRAS